MTGDVRAPFEETRLSYAPAVAEDLLSGDRQLRRAFLEAPACVAQRGDTIISAGQRGPPAFLIRHGIAYCSTTLDDGRRAITDILLPGDIVGIDNIVMAHSVNAVIASCNLSYQPLSGNALREMMGNPLIAMRVLALSCEVRQRACGHLLVLARLDAREKMSTFILGIYDRLRHRDLISRPTFNIELRQDEIADHLGMTVVHVSRTLRRLRGEKLVVVARQVVIILDVKRLREVASGNGDRQSAREAGEVSSQMLLTGLK